MNTILKNKIQKFRAGRATLLLSASLLSSIAQAAQITTDPGDYVALPAGANLAILYGQYATRDEVYADGNKVSGKAGLDTTIGLVRVVHYMELGGIIVDPQIVLPFGTVDLSEAFGPLPETSESGVGDPLVGAAAWLVNKPEQEEWFAVSAFVSIPVGQYDDAQGPINLGENRWKGIFQAAYTKGLGNNFIAELVAEYAIYGDNDDFLNVRREQEDTQSLQTHLRYGLSPQSYIFVSYYHDFGGETTVGGQAQDDKVDSNSWLTGYATFISPTMQLQIQAGQNINVDNGFKEDARLNLRVVSVF